MTEAEEQLQVQITEATAKLKKMEDSQDDLTPIDTNEKVMSIDTNEDPYLKEALEMGFDPNHKGPNKKSAEQFVKDGSFFKKIEEQKRAINELKQMFQESEARSLKIEQETRAKLVAELQAEKERAVEEGDKDKFRKIEAQQKAEEQKIASTPKPLQELPKEVKAFAERNKDWFNDKTAENVLMAKSADGLLTVIQEEAVINNETITLEEALQRVEERIKDVFPKRFKNVNKERPPMVGGVTPSSSGSKSGSLADRLTKDQLNHVKKARMYGSKLTNEEYAKQLQIIGALRDE